MESRGSSTLKAGTWEDVREERSSQRPRVTAAGSWKVFSCWNYFTAIKKIIYYV